jgi:hypothetical protein
MFNYNSLHVYNSLRKCFGTNTEYTAGTVFRINFTKS